jgi:hypothetical protein
MMMAFIDTSLVVAILRPPEYYSVKSRGMRRSRTPGMANSFDTVDVEKSAMNSGP